MKRILIALAAVLLLIPAAKHAEAGADISVDFFYNNLTGGNWIEVGDYGYCWQPSVAVSNADWRPYTDGYWAYTDVGWTWVSYEDFGWATYHYGRWTRARDYGWIWVPGREWGPAWVSWRTGGDHVGWAPLPPRRYGGGGEVIYEGRPIYGQVDIEYDIGPMFYNFIDIRFIGAPVLRQHIYAPAQNVVYLNRTVNVTNITYNNSVVYNYGPDYNRLSAYSTRPIPRLTLQRQTNVDLQAAVQSGGVTKVQGDQLVVAAPATLRAMAQPVAPKQVKTKIAKPELETGWVGVDDPKTRADLQEKMKKEDPKSLPPPQMALQNPAALQAGAPVPAPAAGGRADPASLPAAAEPKGKGKDKRSEKDPQQSIESAPLRDMTPAPAAPPVPRKDPNKGNRVRETDPFTTDSAEQSAPASEGKPPSPAAERGPKNKDRRGGADVPAVQQPADVNVAPPSQPAPQEKAHGGGKPRKNEMKGAPPVPPAGAAAPQGKGKPEKGEKKKGGEGGKPPKEKH